MMDEHEIRLIKDGRKIEAILSSEFLPPTQSHKIRIKSSSTQLILEEEKRWSACPMPQPFHRSSPGYGLLSCQSWKTDRTSIISPCGENRDSPWTGSHYISSPQLSTERTEEKLQLTAFSWEKKELVHVSNAPTFMGATQRNGFCLASLRALGFQKIQLTMGYRIETEIQAGSCHSPSRWLSIHKESGQSIPAPNLSVGREEVSPHLQYPNFSQDCPKGAFCRAFYGTLMRPDIIQPPGSQ